MPKIFAFVTGEYVTDESAEFGDAERRGWVDPSWNLKDFFDSRNDVRPVFDEWLPTDTLPDVLVRDDFADLVREAIAQFGAVEDNGNGTFYSVGGYEDYENGGWYSYAIHFSIKDGADYSERGWHPSEAGIDISDLTV